LGLDPPARYSNGAPKKRGKVDPIKGFHFRILNVRGDPNNKIEILPKKGRRIEGRGRKEGINNVPLSGRRNTLRLEESSAPTDSR